MDGCFRTSFLTVLTSAEGSDTQVQLIKYMLRKSNRQVQICSKSHRKWKGSTSTSTAIRLKNIRFTAMSRKPTILLITGAWHVPAHYARLSNRLRHLGFRVECPTHCTNNNAKPPNKTLDDDIEQIRRLAIKILEDDQDMIAVMHSYGGVVGSSALSSLGKSGQPGIGRITNLVYMSAFLPFEQDSLAAIFGGGLPPWLTPNDEGLIDISEPGQHFYTDLPEAEQAEWVGKLVVHPTAAQFSAPKNTVPEAAWRTIPTVYLVCRNDAALPMAVQEMMVERLEHAQAGLVIQREYCDAGHSPFLSMPEAVVEVVNKLVRG